MFQDGVGKGKTERNESAHTRRYADVRPDLWNVHAVEISVLGQIHLSPLAGSNRKWKLDIELLVINPQGMGFHLVVNNLVFMLIVFRHSHLICRSSFLSSIFSWLYFNKDYVGLICVLRFVEPNLTYATCIFRSNDLNFSYSPKTAEPVRETVTCIFNFHSLATFGLQVPTLFDLL